MYTPEGRYTELDDPRLKLRYWTNPGEGNFPVPYFFFFLAASSAAAFSAASAASCSSKMR